MSGAVVQIRRASLFDEHTGPSLFLARISGCPGHFLIPLINHANKGNPREKGYNASHSSRVVYFVMRKAWWREQGAGWSHCTYVQEAECEQEVGPGQ